LLVLLILRKDGTKVNLSRGFQQLMRAKLPSWKHN
jgi:hypothetical protein